jgi:tetratricopeptide (TPR) repeat protein
MFGEYLYSAGRSEEGIETIRGGLAHERYDLDTNVGLGFALMNGGRYDDAIRQFQNTLVLDPNWGSARLWLAETYAANGNRDEAVHEYLVLLGQALVPARGAAETAHLAAVYAHNGWRAFWQEELDLAEEETRRPGTVWGSRYRRYCGPYYMARRYARLGDRDRAMASLESAYDQRHHLMSLLKLEPLFNSLHSDAAFRDLVRRVGIP